jgi:hypothetical protein
MPHEPRRAVLVTAIGSPWLMARSRWSDRTATKLQALTAGRSIACQEKDRDRYGRAVAAGR